MNLCIGCARESARYWAALDSSPDHTIVLLVLDAVSWLQIQVALVSLDAVQQLTTGRDKLHYKGHVPQCVR